MIKPYQALATDYDGTLAHHGTVSRETLAAIGRLRASGKKLVLVTGRELEELKHVFPDIGLCDLVVAENGALLYWPTTGRIKLLAEPAPQKFAQELRARGVPVTVGRVIVAVRCAQVDRLSEPATPAKCKVFLCGIAGVLAPIMQIVGIGRVDAARPLPHIPRQIIDALRRRAQRVRPARASVRICTRPMFSVCSRIWSGVPTTGGPVTCPNVTTNSLGWC